MPDSTATSTSTSVVFRDVRPLGGEPTDLYVVDGLISDTADQSATVETVDCGGKLALPTLVDAHIHPDKTSWGEKWVSRRPAPGGIADYAAQDVELSRSLATPVAERAHRLLTHAAAQGTRGMRAQVDVAPAYGLEGLEGVNAARYALRGVADVQIVAFPQHGVRRAPGTAELLEEAARTGLIDFVGGIDPMGFDADPDHPTAQLDTVFGIAERHGVGVDVHLHDQGEAGLVPLKEIAARTRASGLGGKVTVSHAFCVPGVQGAEFDRLAEELGEAGVSLTTVAPDSARVLPFARLRGHGVRVGIGSDGVRDAWSPYGNADMLYRAHLLGYLVDARLDEELEDCYLTAAHDGAALLGLPPADLKPGSPADFLLVDGECLAQVVVDMPRRDVVVRGGRVVARDGRLVGA
ncbi:amidohydrolase [Actinomycetota bacterium Odt1-20B]